MSRNGSASKASTAHERRASDDDLVTWWGLVHEGYAAISQAIAADVESQDLPVAWFEVLLRLLRSPDNRLPMTQLAGDVAFSSGGFTKLADRIEAAALVKRTPCAEDRRVTWIGLTPKGRRTVEKALTRHVALLDEKVRSVLGDDGFDQLGALMRTLRDTAKAPIAD